MQISITLNGRPYGIDVEPHLLLIDLLRDTFELSSPKHGCDTGQCGSCIVLLNGISIKSCLMLAVQADGAEITTLEGLAKNGNIGLLQNNLWKKHGIQCNFCTPGIIMSLTDLMRRNPNPDDAEIRHWLEGGLCRCTGYENVTSAAKNFVIASRSPVKMIIDTPGKLMFESRVKLILAGDADRLVEEHYSEDAVLVSFETIVRGREALRTHFRNYLKNVRIEEVISTDRFTETENSFFYEATARTNYGIGRVFDAYYLREGKIIYHFTGTIS